MPTLDRPAPRPHDASMFPGGRPIPLDADPLAVLARWPHDRPINMLHSGRPHPRWSRHTIVAEPTGAYVFDGRESRWVGENKPTVAWAHRPFRDLHTLLDADPRCLWVGYIGYDIGRFIEQLPTRAAEDRAWPVMQLQRCPSWWGYDNTTGAWAAHGSASPCASPPPLIPEPQRAAFRAGEPQPLQTRQAYEQSIRRAIDYIAAGDIFQVNLAQRFTAQATGDPRALYGELARASPAWYGAHVELLTGTGELSRTLCSASPELFLDVAPDGRVVTRPIKGTRPATAPAAALRDSAKDTAELHMIVDLLRNDLGRVCDCGSVRVEQAREIESHPTVHHGVATISGTLHRSLGLIDLLRATLPGGSITGAPKVRAMQVIDELEPVRRGPYCGIIGFIHGGAHRPTARFNLAIRTLLAQADASGRGRIDFSVGGGIVADSVPADEYQETLDKAQAMLRGLAAGRAIDAPASL